MLRPGFRLKLVCAMMAVVGLATGASLLVAQRRMREAYQRLSEQQFHAQFDRFAELQETRLATVQERCLSLVTDSVRLRAAVEENEAELIYRVAGDELRSLDGDSLRRTRLSFFLFFDRQAQLIPPPTTPAQAVVQSAQLGRNDRWRLVRPVLEGARPQQLGVAALAGPDGAPRLYELVVTRIPGPDAAGSLGALLLAFPAVLPGRPPAPKAAGTESAVPGAAPAGIRFGIWSEGSLYTHEPEFSAPELAELSRRLTERLPFAGTAGNFTENLAGETQQVMFQALTVSSPDGTGDATFQIGVYSLAELRRQQAALRRQILLLGAVALAGALGVSLVLAHGLSVPIRDLRRGTTEVRGGNFLTRVPVRSRDELGELAEAFNEMTAGLELKERYRRVLNSVADEKIARQLLDGGLALGGEVRPVTVLFCDIRGFTAHTENMAPTGIVELLNEHMTALTGVVKTHHGVLDKFVGDLLMALFGAPLTRGTDVCDAARAALGIIAERHRLNETSQHRLQVGIGLATGEVVAGCMGSVDRLNYTVIGERVNLASRLCSLAKAGQVVIDDATRAALGEAAEVRPLPPVRLKGFSGEIQAFELVAIREPATA